jgi:hypothetical protein
MNRLKLLRVEFMPMTLEEGILYFSKKYSVAAHLCPCGCGNKIITPVGRNEWSYREKKGRPSLYPSIGNWQLPCRSHYWIIDGRVEWSYDWTEEEIADGAAREEDRRKTYYDQLYGEKKKPRLWEFITKWFIKE